ncbi:cytochrome P450 [Streptosporangiaceae bacterium NEAU-GS5]|nr:cytochrome P450 [Streptosporangiaceae bacterium NEAU-GS5]
MAKMFDTSLRLDAPGPAGRPLINNLRFMAHPAWYCLDRLAPVSPGPVLAATRGNGSIVVVRGEEAVRQYFTDNDTFHRIGDGVLELPRGRSWSQMFDAVITFNGDRHRRARKLLMPIVHKSAMEHYRVVFAETFKRSRFARADGEPFDIAAEFLSITRANMLTCLLGLEPDEANVRLAERVARLMKSVFNPAIFLFQVERPWTPYGWWTRTVAGLYDEFVALIERTRAAEPRPDALSILCHTVDEDGDSLSPSEIAGELHGLFAAGFETTAMTMTWALIALAGTPGLETDGEADVDALVKESQRLIPTVPISLPRRTTREVEIDGSAPVPKGAMIVASPLLEHLDPESFPDPHAFRPSRWDDLRPSPYRFLPFGVGQRRCLGASFADLQVRTTLGLALESAAPELRTGTIDYVIRSGVTAFPRKPVFVRMTNGPVRSAAVSGSVRKLWKT